MKMYHSRPPIPVRIPGVLPAPIPAPMPAPIPTPMPPSIPQPMPPLMQFQNWRFLDLEHLISTLAEAEADTQFVKTQFDEILSIVRTFY
jgi:hypothetical protein